MKNIHKLSNNENKPLGYKIQTNDLCDVCGKKGMAAFNAAEPKNYLFKLRDNKQGCTKCARKLGII